LNVPEDFPLGMGIDIPLVKQGDASEAILAPDFAPGISIVFPRYFDGNCGHPLADGAQARKMIRPDPMNQHCQAGAGGGHGGVKDY
jgi:hypothetical protein